MRAGLQPGQDAVSQIKSVGNANEAEAGVWEVRPFKDGVEDILGFAVKLVHFIQDKKPGGESQNLSHHLGIIWDTLHHNHDRKLTQRVQGLKGTSAVRSVHQALSVYWPEVGKWRESSEVSCS